MTRRNSATKTKVTKKYETLTICERVVTFRSGTSPINKFCAVCGNSVIFVSVDDAAKIRQATARQIFRLAEADALHWLETDNGRLLICFSSLARLAEDNFFASGQKKIN